MTRVYFVRHAQPDYRSETDRTRPLTDEGRRDSQAVLRFLQDKQITAFYCSPYRRSMDTIAASAQCYGQSIHTDERLRERESGPDGNRHELFRRRWADFDWHEPGGESLRSVQQRNIAALLDILEANRSQNLVIGTHGTALSTILNYFDSDFDCDSFLRIIDWMPFIVELDFEDTTFLSKKEHIHVEKVYLP